MTAHETQTLNRLKTAARVSIGLVWIYEGLVPKIFFPDALQHDMVARSGLWLGSPEATLFWLGMAIAFGGLVIISGWKERLMALLSTLAVLVLMVCVIGTHPAALYDPFGGLIKDTCLFVCAAIIWWWPPSLRQTAVTGSRMGMPRVAR
jgi:DoxX-like family